MPRRRAESGQAMVETALTLPMLTMALLGILQMAMVYHARLLTEYAAFKAARAASVYRLSCTHMNRAARMALIPSMGVGDLGAAGCGDPTNTQSWTANQEQCVRARFGAVARRVAFANHAAAGQPLVTVNYRVTDALPEGQFDRQLERGELPMRVHVRVAYFYQYRIPFVNRIMARYWLAANQAFMSWSQVDPTMQMKRADGGGRGGNVESELVDRASMLIRFANYYTTPIVATWSMRMMSDPLETQRPEDAEEIRTCSALM